MQAAAMAAIGTHLPGSSLPSKDSKHGLAFVGTMGEASCVHTYSVRDGQWKLLHTIQCKAPIAMLVHPTQDMFYVLNQINEHEGLPRGTVETYRLGRETGALQFLNRQPLSLSAISPSSMALSPDGRTLAVAVAGGGAYNLLPVLESGQLGRVSSVIKETGSGPVAGQQDAAHPQSVIFTEAGTLIASDLGCDRLSTFSIEDGISVTGRIQLPAGSGPRHLAVHPHGDLLFADHALGGSASVFRRNGSGLGATPLATIGGAFGDALAIHPSGDFLYSAAGEVLTAWRIDLESGGLNPVHSIAVEAVRALLAAPDGLALFALTPRGVLRVEIAAVGGQRLYPQLTASISDTRSILFL